MPDTFQGHDATIEITPKRVTIKRKDRVSDIELRYITAVDLFYPRAMVRGRFRIVYQGAPIYTANVAMPDAYSIVEFDKSQQLRFEQLRSLIHQYQDQLTASLP